MHCKFWCFCFLFLFLFFSRACEVWFVERLGAHGRQNPNFIIVVVVVVVVVVVTFPFFSI